MKNFILKHKITIGACALMLVFGFGWWVLAQAPTKTSIGDDIIVKGSVGIGTTSPTLAKLQVQGGVIRAENAVTQDAVVLGGRAGGTGSYAVTLIPTTLSANRTLTLPNVAGTAITTGNLSSITSVGTLTNSTLTLSAASAILSFSSTTGTKQLTTGSGTHLALMPGGTGNVGIGTTSPGAKLEVAGQVKITGGSPGANKVLGSDSAGLASWRTINTSSNCSWTTTAVHCDESITCPTGQFLAGVQRTTVQCSGKPYLRMYLYCCYI